MYSEVSGFWVRWNITFKNKYCHCVITHIHLTQYICSTFSHFSNCWARMVFQVTVHNQCPKCPPPEAMHISTRKITDCRTNFTVPGAVANGLTETKVTFLKCLLVFSWSWMHYGFKYLHWQKSKELGSTSKTKYLLPAIVTQEQHVLPNNWILDVPRVLWHGLGLYPRGMILCRLWHPGQPLWDLW